MFCPKCGNELPDTAAFCNACGATIEKKAPAATDAASAAAGVGAGAGAKSLGAGVGAGLNPKLIGVVAAIVVIVIALVVGVGSCSSNNGNQAGTTSASQNTATSTTNGTSANGGNAGTSQTTSPSVNYAGTWKDYDYGDTMELNSNGFCIINQKGVGTTYWQWEETSSGIRIQSDSKAYSLTYGFVDGRETLYNNSKGLKFQR